MYNTVYIPQPHKASESGGVSRVNIKLHRPCNKYAVIAISVKVIFAKEVLPRSKSTHKAMTIIIEGNRNM